MKKYFIWPESSFLNAILNWPLFSSSKKIESQLFRMFPSGYPVLCSSGRSALYLSLNHLEKKRGDLVGVFPYASHCVIDSMSRITTPCFGEESKNCDLRIIYHQWGYVQEKDVKNDTIDDCVDSLYHIGKKLFPSGSEFEIWSLPKILGTSSGGVLWCKNKQDSIKIKQLRNQNGNSFFQWILRLVSKKIPFFHHYWNGAEPVAGKPSSFQCAEIFLAINKWDKILNDRLEKFNLLWEFSIDGIKKPTDRIPCVIPVKSTKPLLDFIENNFSSGPRMMEIIQANKLSTYVQVIPIPVHQDVDLNWLKSLKNFLKSK